MVVSDFSEVVDTASPEVTRKELLESEIKNARVILICNKHVYFWSKKNYY